MRISLPSWSRPLQYRAVTFTTIKRVYLIGVVLLAIASGHNEFAIHAQEITVQASSLPVAYHNDKVAESAMVIPPTRQLTIISIDKKKRIIPTPAPTARVLAGSAAPGSNSGGSALLQALNSYRQKNSKAVLSWDSKLAAFAQQRADFFYQRNDLDSHAGFNDFINNQDGFHKLGFWHLGENSAIGHRVSPQQLIEDVYGKSAGHNENELSDKYTHVGIGSNGTATNFVFGGRKM